MIAKIKSCGLIGLDGYIIEVEADISNGIPAFDNVGFFENVRCYFESLDNTGL